ncbi:myelin and lymphocyte protein-like [Anabas testudineus]|uniref:Myelin and lymphocyte protein n=1 Tax=Anabas testudineus TaxID=64144 RepID=A0A3Q1JRR5_ANATE|nr:myelin and lymphocyte protein-like [Anabas testudineus]
MASTTSGDVLPTGGRIFTSIPDVFFIPEFVFGGLVWILVAATRVIQPNPLGWVMFVSIFCFVGTTLWFFTFLCGGNKRSIWPVLDVGFHFVATVFYLSASVVLAFITVTLGQLAGSLGQSSGSLGQSSGSLGQSSGSLGQFAGSGTQIYQLYIAAVVMSYVATLFYFLHTIFSAIRWKRS